MVRINLLVFVAVLLCFNFNIGKFVGTKLGLTASHKATLKDTYYTGYVLAASWAKTTCAMKTCNPNLNIPNNIFNLHGLWPTDLENNNSPADCYYSSLNLPSLSADVQNIVKTYWNSLYGPMESFVGHEWSKHGTCMNFKLANLANVPLNLKALVQNGVNAFNQASDIPREETFIRMSAALSQTYNFYSALASKGIYPGSSLILLEDVQNALKTYFKVSKVNVYCGKTGARTMNISEVRICLSNDFIPVDCPNDTVGCPKQFYYTN